MHDIGQVFLVAQVPDCAVHEVGLAFVLRVPINGAAGEFQVFVEPEIGRPERELAPTAAARRDIAGRFQNCGQEGFVGGVQCPRCVLIRGAGAERITARHHDGARGSG